MAARVAHGTLTAGVVSTVTLGTAYRKVEVWADGSADLYARLDGLPATVAGDDCEWIPAGTGRTVPVPYYSIMAGSTPVSSASTAFHVTGPYPGGGLEG
jgi:hypothetical protein